MLLCRHCVAICVVVHVREKNEKGTELGRQYTHTHTTLRLFQREPLIITPSLDTVPPGWPESTHSGIGTEADKSSKKFPCPHRARLSKP